MNTVFEKNIPFIARIIIVQDGKNRLQNKMDNNSYYNNKLDSENEYCQNTTAWD